MHRRSLSATMAWSLFTAWSVSALALAAPSMPLAASPSDRIDYDIPPQSLAAAVEAYAVASGIQVLYDRPTGVEPWSLGVRGSLTPQAALEKLLAGTGLLARFTGAGNVILEAQPTADDADPGPPPQGLASLDLGTVHVVAPPTVETAGSPLAAARLYGRLVKAYVTAALATDAKTSKDAYVAGVSVWIAPSGAIKKVAMFNSTGNGRMDAAICVVLERLVLGDPPPKDFPQPINIKIRSVIRK